MLVYATLGQSLKLARLFLNRSNMDALNAVRGYLFWKVRIPFQMD